MHKTGGMVARHSGTECLRHYAMPIEQENRVRLRAGPD